jgi:prepilin-type N-terminal cleavage/methylation domain-containing protein
MKSKNTGDHKPKTLWRCGQGFTLVEILLALMLFAAAIGPVMGALSPSPEVSGFREQTLCFLNQARGTLSRVAALDFEALDNNLGDPVDLAVLFKWPGAPSQSEADKERFSFKGIDYMPVVAVTDASGGEGGLVQLRVTIESVTLTRLKADY